MYKAKYRITSDVTLKGYEQAKIYNGVKREMNNQFTWKLLSSALLVAFVIIVIYLMVHGGL